MNPLKTLALSLMAGGLPVAVIGAFFRLPDTVQYVAFALFIVGLLVMGLVTEGEKKARTAGSSSVQSSSEQQNR